MTVDKTLPPHPLRGAKGDAMRDLACIRHDLLKATGDEAARLRRLLAVAVRIENKRLARRLRYKADIYGPFGRI